MESSETNQIQESRPRVVLFILNRNGLDEQGLRAAIALILDTKFAASDVEILWLSIFGKQPEQPHVLLTLSDDEVAREMIGQLPFTMEDTDYHFEVMEASGSDPSEGEDPLAIFVSGVPVNLKQEQLRAELTEFFSRVAPVKSVIFGKEWQRKKSVILLFENNTCARMVARACVFCTFRGQTMRCSYARKMFDSPPQRSTPQDKGKKSKRDKPKRDYFIEAHRK